MTGVFILVLWGSAGVNLSDFLESVGKRVEVISVGVTDLPQAQDDSRRAELLRKITQVPVEEHSIRGLFLTEKYHQFWSTSDLRDVYVSYFQQTLFYKLATTGGLSTLVFPRSHSLLISLITLTFCPIRLFSQ